MKKGIAIYSLLVFIFMAFLLLLENIKAADTSLFFLNGQSVGLQNYHSLFNLSPLIMGFLFWIVVIANVICIKFKKLYLSLPIGNFMLAIPVFLVHRSTLFFHPFLFSDGITKNISILRFVWFIYLSIIGLAILVTNLSFRNNKIITYL